MQASPNNNQKSQNYNFIKWLLAGDTHQVTARIGLLAGSVVAASGFILGYMALFDLFSAIGLFPVWLGVFFPLLFDALEITAAVFVLNSRFNDREDKTAWRVVVGVTVAAVVANISHAGYAWHTGDIDLAQAGLAVIFTSIFPVAVAITVHLIKSQITRNVERDDAIKTITDLQTEAQHERSVIEQIKQDQAQLADEKAQQEAQFLERKAQQEAQLKELQTAIERAKKEVEQAQKRLTEPDLEVIQAYQIDGWVAAGGTQVAIADRLNISTSTVRNRMKCLNGHSLIGGAS